MTEQRGLSPDDRKFLQGRKEEYAHETTEVNTWQRVRERTRRSILDGLLLWQELPDAQRRKIFDVGPEEDLLWKDVEEYDYSDVVAMRAKESEFEELEQSLVGLLALLYAGIDEHPELDFDSMLADALASVAHKRGEVPLPETYQPPKLETEAEFDTEELLKDYKLGDPLSPMEELHLRRAVEGPLEELDRYVDEPGKDIDPAEFVDREELAEMLSPEDEGSEE